MYVHRPPGILVYHQGKETPFWYECTREEAADAFRTHCIHHGREALNWKWGEPDPNVDPRNRSVRIRPLEEYKVMFVTKFKPLIGQCVPETAEELDPKKLLGY